MLLYACFRFSEAMDQLFLTVLSAMQGSFRAMLGVASIFVNVLLRPGWGTRRCPPSPTTTFVSFFFFSFFSYNMRTA